MITKAAVSGTDNINFVYNVDDPIFSFTISCYTNRRISPGGLRVAGSRWTCPDNRVRSTGDGRLLQMNTIGTADRRSHRTIAFHAASSNLYRRTDAASAGGVGVRASN